MNVLIACEKSQIECSAFRELGHRCFSCDIYPAQGGHPEWHIHGDVLKLFDQDICFTTENGEIHSVNHWDLIIAHPPCTHLSVSGERWFTEGRKPLSLRYEGAEFFMRMVEAPAKCVAVENPLSVMSSLYRKADQTIQPWMFGHPECKRTCLWLKNLPKLIPTNDVFAEIMLLSERERNRILCLGSGHGDERSTAFPGIAKAMAEQWGEYVLHNL